MFRRQMQSHIERHVIHTPGKRKDNVEQFATPAQCGTDQLQFVPAPKSQHWRVARRAVVRSQLLFDRPGSAKPGTTLKPLTHVTLKDRVAATALMMCIADRIETLQGEPRAAMTHAAAANGSLRMATCKAFI